MTEQKPFHTLRRLNVALAALVSAVVATLGFQVLGLDFLVFPGAVLGLLLFLLSSYWLDLPRWRATLHLLISVSIVTGGWYLAVRLFLAAFQFLDAQTTVPIRLTDVTVNTVSIAAIAGFPAGLLGGLAVGLALSSAAPDRMLWPLLWRSLLMGAMAGSVAMVAYYAVMGMNWGRFVEAVTLFFVWQLLVLTTLYSLFWKR